MDFKVGVGKSNFTDLRNAGNDYADKTEILYELLQETDHEVLCSPDPAGLERR